MNERLTTGRSRSPPGMSKPSVVLKAEGPRPGRHFLDTASLPRATQLALSLPEGPMYSATGIRP